MICETILPMSLHFHRTAHVTRLLPLLMSDFHLCCFLSVASMQSEKTECFHTEKANVKETFSLTIVFLRVQLT